MPKTPIKNISWLYTLPLFTLTALPVMLASSASYSEDSASQRQALYGDLHLHTTYSFDAYVMMGTTVDPDTAYRFAKGETIDYLGQAIRRNKPLDFLAVTDHAENIGFFNQLQNPDSEFARSEFGKIIAKKLSNNDGSGALGEIIKYQMNGKPLPGSDSKTVGKATWQRIIDSANRYYQPGAFTTFIGYEWTSMVDGANLHRNVIFRGDEAPTPFSSTDSRNPEDLWHYLETIRKDGHEALAIPHNANASNGLMFDWNRQNGLPIDADYARLRAFNEPLNEIAQNKGTSETHPLLSPNDEFANFEIFDIMLTLPPARKGKLEGSYLRDALGRGLLLEQQLGVNPFTFGFVGASDLHGGLSASAENAYGGSPSVMNLGGGKPSKETARKVLMQGDSKDVHTGTSPTVASSGTLTGVWAESNTREDIYKAFRRKEVFATSGTRIKLRFFAGWDFNEDLLAQPEWVTSAYARGVTMGNKLPASSRAGSANPSPGFVVYALKDPDSGNLDRAQIIKVWLDNGEQQEKIYNVAWSKNTLSNPGKRQINANTGALPAIGDTVDLTTGKYRNDVGAVELATVWTDPDFDPDQSAVYYLRVLEIPTPRWTTLLAIENKLPIPSDVAATIQERAWSSPIWYTPATNQ